MRRAINEACLPEAHFAAIFEPCGLDPAPIDEGPVDTPQIFERIIARLGNDTCVALGDRRVLDDELVVEGPAYLDLAPVENIGNAPFTVRRDCNKCGRSSRLSAAGNLMFAPHRAHNFAPEGSCVEQIGQSTSSSGSGSGLPQPVQRVEAAPLVPHSSQLDRV